MLLCKLVWKLKSQGAQAATGEIAALIALAIRSTHEMILVPTPTATSRARQRGYDQPQLIARALARELQLAYATALRRLGQHNQVGASRKQQPTQSQDAYRYVQPDRIAGKHVLLVDDVLTTGATMESAAHVIKAAGIALV